MNILLLLFISILFFLLIRLTNKNDKIYLLRVNTALGFIAGLFFYVYIIFLQIVLQPRLSGYSSSEIKFFNSSILFIASILLAYTVYRLLIKPFYKKTSNRKVSEVKYMLSTKTINILIVSILILVLIYIQLIFGGLSNYLFKRYGYFNAGNMNSITAIIPLFLSSFILVFNTDRIFVISKRNRRKIFSISIILIILFMLGGNRNLSIIMLLALFWSKLNGNKINLLKYLPLGIGAFLISSIVAVGREYGLINFLTKNSIRASSNFWQYTLLLKGTEFGTMYRVEDYFNRFNFINPSPPFYSYFISPIEQLIPSIIYPNRQHSIAVEFTKQYWGGLGEGTIGLGFSPIIEAKISLGQFWPIMIFMITIVGSIILSSISKNTTNYYLFAGSVFCASLNFFRIDFALFVKFFLLIFIFSKIFIKAWKFFAKRTYTLVINY